MAEGGSPGSLDELDPDGTPTAKACILGCGLLRPDPDGDDPKRSGPEGDPDPPKPEADPDPEADGDLGPNLNVEGDPDVELDPEAEAEPEAEADPEPEADEEPLADAPLSDLDSPLLTFK